MYVASRKARVYDPARGVDEAGVREAAGVHEAGEARCVRAEREVVWVQVVVRRGRARA